MPKLRVSVLREELPRLLLINPLAFSRKQVIWWEVSLVPLFVVSNQFSPNESPGITLVSGFPDGAQNSYPSPPISPVHSSSSFAWISRAGCLAMQRPIAPLGSSSTTLKQKRNEL